MVGNDMNNANSLNVANDTDYHLCARNLRMAFFEELLEGGSTYRVKATNGGAIFHPISDSDDDLDTFQDVAGQIEDNQGEGYDVFLTHLVSAHGRNLIDRVVITIE